MKKAFTLIEIVVVLVIIGILALVATPKISIDTQAQDATDQVIRHIRYTQHLAMMEDRFAPDESTYEANGCSTNQRGKWFKERWKIVFKEYTQNSVLKTFYLIHSDRNRCGNINPDERAIDPSNPAYYLDGDATPNPHPDLNLTDKYKVSRVSFTQNCAVNGFSLIQDRTGTILFDELGRPYGGVSNDAAKPYDYLLATACDINLTHTSGKSCLIRVEPITGYTHQIGTCQ